MDNADDNGQSYYDVLGVEPTASKEEIREAYRAELMSAQAQVADAETAKKPSADAISNARSGESQVRKAWQVLSDEYQRERYDESGSPTMSEDFTPDDTGVELVAPSKAIKKAEPTTAKERRAAAMANRPPGLFSKDHPPIPKTWPKGFTPPPPRGRLSAMGIDVLVLLVLLVVQQTIGVWAVEQVYPKETKRLEAVSTQLDQQEKNKSKAENQLDKAKVADDKAAAKADIKTADKEISKLEEKQKKIGNDILPGQLGLTVITLMIALLYLIPFGRRSGQTLGKKMLQIRVVMLTGAPLTMRGALLRYGLPVFIALLLSPILGPVGYVAVLFGVLTWPRNANYQGLHDRLAGTIVVDG